MKDAIKFGAYDYRNEFIDLIFGGADRLSNLRQMLYDIIIAGGDIYISSRGNKQFIMKSLQLAGIDVIINSSNITGSEKPKVHLLNELIASRDVFYVDDDHEEHNKFCTQLHGLGCDPGSRTETSELTSCIIRGHKYKFMNSLVKNVGGGLNDAQMARISKIFNESLHGGSLTNALEKEKRKHRKYKDKYIQLKKNLEK